MDEQAPQLKHSLREIFNASRWLVRAGCPWQMLPNDLPPWPAVQSTPESSGRAGFDGHKKRKGSKVHVAVDTLGHLLALKVTAANEQDRAPVAELSHALQKVTGRTSKSPLWTKATLASDRPSPPRKPGGG